MSVRSGAGSGIDLFVQKAVSQRGTLEKRGNSTPYGRWYGMDGAAYCAIGLSWTAGHTGQLEAVGGKWAYCPYISAHARNTGRWARNGRGLKGDWVLFDWSGQHRIGHEMHVGVLTADQHRDGTVSTLEFNTSAGGSVNESDGEGVWTRRRGGSSVVGFYRPQYVSVSRIHTVRLTRASRSSSRHGVLLIDGVWGHATTRALQRYVHVRVDGELGPATRRGMQGWLAVDKDGAWGPVTWRALQRRLKVTATGRGDKRTVRALQQFLNRA